MADSTPKWNTTLPLLAPKTPQAIDHVSNDKHTQDKRVNFFIIALSTFSQHFSAINDPHQLSKVTYPLFDMVFLTIVSLLVNCQGWEDIVDFSEERLEWLQQ